MIFGIRFDFRNPAFSGVGMAARYEAALEMTVWADRHGGVSVSLSEHHGSDDGYLPSPLVMAAAVAARTSSIRIGINALVAPFHDPLRIAEDAAVVDHLSRGRLDLTITGGYVPEEFEMFGVPLAARPSTVRKAVETLRQAWTGEPFDHEGRTAQITPTPFQSGGPRIVLGGSSEAAARRAARIADGFMPSEEQFWSFYRDECLKLGKDDPGPGDAGGTDVVMLAEDPEQAWVDLGPYFLHEVNAYGAWQAAAGVDAGYRSVDDIDSLRTVGQYRILTPDAYAEELRLAGDDAFVMLHPMVGGVPPEMAWEHLDLFERTFLTPSPV